MKVKKELFTSKTLANGEHPVIIRIYHQKTKVISTGVSTKPEYWNKEKQVIKCQDKSYKEKNKIINNEFLRINQRVAEFDAIDRAYDLELLVSNEEITEISNEETIEEETPTIYDNFFDVLAAKIDDYPNEGTKRNYKQLAKCLKELYGKTIPIKNINQKWFTEFQIKIASKGVKQARELIKRFSHTYQWGFENGLFENLKPITYNKNNYSSTIKKRSLNVEGFTFLRNMFKYEMYRTLEERINYTYECTDYVNALNIYLVIVAMGGIAPVDISHLKVKDLLLQEKNSIPLDYNKVTDQEYMNNWYRNNKKLKYYKIEYLRIKTGKPATTYPPFEILEELIKPYLYKKDYTRKNENDYLLNVFSIEKQLTKIQEYARISNYFNTLKKNLNSKLIEVKSPCSDFTFYSARHTSLNMMNYKGIDHNLIASNAGHNVETLERSYLTDFEVEKLIEANKKIWE